MRVTGSILIGKREIIDQKKLKQKLEKKKASEI